MIKLIESGFLRIAFPEGRCFIHGTKSTLVPESEHSCHYDNWEVEQTNGMAEDRANYAHDGDTGADAHKDHVKDQ